MKKLLLLLITLLPIIAWAQPVVQQKKTPESGSNAGNQYFQWYSGSYTGYLIIPVWTNAIANRSIPINGQFGFQTSDSTGRVYYNGNWLPLGAGGSSSSTLYLNGNYFKNNGSTPTLAVRLADTVNMQFPLYFHNNGHIASFDSLHVFKTPTDPVDVVRLMDLNSGYIPNAVINGLALTLINDTTLEVTPGAWRINNLIYSNASNTFLRLAKQDSVKSRYEVVYATTADTIGIVSGVLSVTPIIPAIPPNTLYAGLVLITPTQIRIMPVSGAYLPLTLNDPAHVTTVRGNSNTLNFDFPHGGSGNGTDFQLDSLTGINFSSTGVNSKGSIVKIDTTTLSIIHTSSNANLYGILNQIDGMLFGKVDSVGKESVFNFGTFDNLNNHSIGVELDDPNSALHYFDTSNESFISRCGTCIPDMNLLNNKIASNATIYTRDSTLNGNRTISSGGHNFILQDSTTFLGIFPSPTTPALTMTASTATESTAITVSSHSNGGATMLYQDNGTSATQQFQINKSIVQYQDNIFHKGIEYKNIQRGTFTDSTLVTKKYVDSVSAGSGSVPSSRTLTINGTTQDLSANRTWSVGTVTSIATSTGITGGTITGTGTLKADTTVLQTVANFFPKGDTRYARTGATGTVTSVAATPSQGVTISGSPITTSGTFGIGLGNITPTTLVTTIKPATVYQTAAGTAGTDSVMVKHSGGIVDAISPTYYATSTSDALKAPIASPTFTGTVTIPNGGVFGVPTSMTATNVMGLPLTTGVTGILPYANGGTNANTSWTTGSVIFGGASAFAQDNAKFFWDDTHFWLGLGTAVPTAAVTVASTLNATAFDSYNTTDQVTNFERLRLFWSSNVLNISTQNGGTGTLRSITINGQSVSFGAGGTTRLSVTGTAMIGAVNVPASVSSAGVSSFGINGTMTNSSGTVYSATIVPTINQTSTAATTMFLISPLVTAVGSGVQNLVDFGTNSGSNGSGTHTSKFKVDFSGNETITGNMIHNGSSSGVVTETVQAAAGTFNWNYPITAGTAGQVLTSQGGAGTAMTWSTASITQGSADLTAQTSAGNITTFTVGATTATFNVSAYINVTAVATDVIQAQITYTDENSTSQTVSFTTLSTVTNSTYSPVTIRAKNGTVITVKTNLTTGIGSITFDCGSRITQL